MEQLYLISPAILSLIILFLPERIRFFYTSVYLLLVVAFTTTMAIQAWMQSPENIVYAFISGDSGVTFTISGISAFFILITNLTTLTGLFFGRAYLRPYRLTMTRTALALHDFSYVWLYLSMLAVLTLRSGLSFLIAWELMGVSSFLLILFEAGKRQTLKTAVNYLVQMHVGMVFLLVGFLVVEKYTGTFGFDGLTLYFSEYHNLPVFLLFFIGFAFKAGFIPFHTWLPEAHPAAPSHVSGVMSGVMIKMGFFGMLSVIATLHSDLLTIGLIILVAGALTGLYGIMQSVVQTDLKRMLAFSTIENAGIIGIGTGAGTIGLAMGNTTIALLGFSGAAFHILNHSLFKSLLFYTSGTVYQATHTRNMDQMGGLIHHMPRTAGLFLLASTAICALPPLNGFISEVLIYYSLFAGLQTGSFYLTIVMMLAILALAVIGGLAIFGFSRAFGITFLGSPRTGIVPRTGSEPPSILAPLLFPALLIIAIGLLPSVFLPPVVSVMSETFHLEAWQVISPLIPVLFKVSLTGLILIAIIGLILLIRKGMKVDEKTVRGPTWGCGYTAGTARQQYTASSFSANFSELANPLLRTKEEFIPVQEEEIFPENRKFRRISSDLFASLLSGITGFSVKLLRNIARLQTGNIRHYILYAFLFMLIVFGLLYLGLI